MHKKAMLYSLILITILLLTFVQCAFLVSYKKRSFITGVLLLSKNSRLPQIIFAAAICPLLFILFLLLKDLSSPQPGYHLVPVSNPSYSNMTTSAPLDMGDLHQVGHEDYGIGENDYYVYIGSDLSKKTLEQFAQHMKAENCKKPCIINFYDNLNAYKIDLQRKTIVSSSIMQEWNKKNYVFVAEHYLGYLPFTKYTSFFYYPYKDAYYYSLLRGK